LVRSRLSVVVPGGIVWLDSAPLHLHPVRLGFEATELDAPTARGRRPDELIGLPFGQRESVLILAGSVEHLAGLEEVAARAQLALRLLDMLLEGARVDSEDATARVLVDPSGVLPLVQ